jgi:hypothetical protein
MTPAAEPHAGRSRPTFLARLPRDSASSTYHQSTRDEELRSEGLAVSKGEACGVQILIAEHGRRLRATASEEHAEAFLMLRAFCSWTSRLDSTVW